ncbi:UDP-N-acetylmuramoyl-L-alanyl-D-glutamate--2,6-diaminopimelate ligase [Desertimonas flava]|uniref:UDP-N-acetylmuramoyl-L-alanyl-D-glutamate--2, 6-diaminopimelate ligase n=1 Tax=Desertimonas flava TaxID=2064846 RepID=UPI001969A30F|nr:UDP-N-acetylmuramoyl-L-alanyl-D-glutamate--2,6-diaminopimelate ligase [Desertimonas flava]
MITLDDLRTALPKAAQARVVGDATRPVAAITHDSRAVTPGGMFACLRGEHFDGHDFAAAAVDAGATSLLVDHPLSLDESAVSQLVVADTRRALGTVASAVFGNPSTSLRVIGITGTNGKTTTSALLASILRAAGDPTGVIGTLSGAHTTPEAPELQARLASMHAEGDLSVVMEVSSHALALHRADGIRFDAAVFTNLGRDHLDLHGTQEEYFRAKASLFEPGRAVVGVVNVDDVHGRLLFDAAPIEMVPFSREDAGADVTVTASSLRFTWRGVRLDVPIGGTFNLMNAIAAATTAAAVGIGIDAIVTGLATAPAVPGRFERVLTSDGTATAIDVVVDYAHTPDGLEEVIAAGGAVVGERGRVIVVFGAGGDRDRDKRPAMGAVAARLADIAVVTSDNPRSEDPRAIIDAVVAGIGADDRGRVEVVVDRADAIKTAITLAEPGDMVIIAGKGHETTQTIGSEVLPFDDREVARKVLEGRA